MHQYIQKVLLTLIKKKQNCGKENKKLSAYKNLQMHLGAHTHIHAHAHMQMHYRAQIVSV